MKKTLLFSLALSSLLLAQSDCQQNLEKGIDYVKVGESCIKLEGVFGERIKELANEYTADQKAFDTKYGHTPPPIPTTPPAPKKSIKATSSTQGIKLYAKCIACHGAKAEKKGLNKSEVIRGWSAEKLYGSLKEYKAGTRNKHGMGALMKGQLATYSDAELKTLSEYISTL